MYLARRVERFAALFIWGACLCFGFDAERFSASFADHRRVPCRLPNDFDIHIPNFFDRGDALPHLLGNGLRGRAAL
jgi:hypothetical protein